MRVRAARNLRVVTQIVTLKEDIYTIERIMGLAAYTEVVHRAGIEVYSRWNYLLLGSKTIDQVRGELNSHLVRLKAELEQEEQETCPTCGQDI